MANDVVKVDYKRVDRFYQLTAVVQEPVVLPAFIFVYENTGTAQLGTYQGIASPGQLSSLRVFNPSQVVGTNVAKYLLWNQAKILSIPLSADMPSVVNGLLSSISTLYKSLSTLPEVSETYTFPLPK